MLTNSYIIDMYQLVHVDGILQSLVWNIGQNVFRSKVLMHACNMPVWIVYWEALGFWNLAVLIDEHIDSYLNYLCAFSIS